jgi:hypothetical protein
VVHFYMAKYGPLGIETARLASIEWSVSGAEHSRSIGAWFHSKKRNRLSQTNVERPCACTPKKSEPGGRAGRQLAHEILARDLEKTIDEEAEEETDLAGGVAAVGGGSE